MSFNKKFVMERVISDEIDRINDIKCNKPITTEENNITDVWLRDSQIEVDVPIGGSTTGNLPVWLNGNLLRNGPGRKTFGNEKFCHLFDSSAMLHSFKIKDGEAKYQCKLLKSEAYLNNLAANRITMSEFGTAATPDPCKTIFQKFSALFESKPFTDNCLVTIYPLKDELYAFTESPRIHKINQNLDSERIVDISKTFNVVHHTAHPHVTNDGTLYSIGLSPGGMKGPNYSIIEFPNTKKDAPKDKDVFDEAYIVAKIPVRWPLYPGYMHSFGITENYFLIVEQPLSISVPTKIKLTFKEKSLNDLLQWYDQPTLIHVVSRKDGKTVKTFEAEPFFYFHIINQYEEDGHIVIDICAYKDAKVIEYMLIEALKNAKDIPNYASFTRSNPFRFVLPMDGEKIKIEGTQATAIFKNNKTYVVPELLSKLGCELPTIHYPMFSGKKYRFFYAISEGLLENPGMLIKVDTATKTELTWSENGTFPSEPIFVPSPSYKDEDDGVVLSALLWSSDPNKVALLVLDAKSFTELGRTVFKTPGPVPKCFHGWFTNDVV